MFVLQFLPHDFVPAVLCVRRSDQSRDTSRMSFDCQLLRSKLIRCNVSTSEVALRPHSVSRYVKLRSAVVIPDILKNKYPLASRQRDPDPTFSVASEATRAASSVGIDVLLDRQSPTRTLRRRPLLHAFS